MSAGHRGYVRRSGFTIPYQHPAPNQKHHVTGRSRRLPNITGSCARGADPIGSFGLVVWGITNPYRPAHAFHSVVLDWSPDRLPSLTILRIWVHTCRA